MSVRYRRMLIALIALGTLVALTGCAGATSASTASAPTPTTAPAPTTALAPTAAPGLARDREMGDELNAEIYFQTWIHAVTTSDADVARIVYRVGSADPSAAIERQFQVLRHFITQAEQPSNTYGAYQGFHQVVGSYPEHNRDQRTGIALMQFERVVVCFYAELRYVEAQNTWSVEQWHPITWDLCEPRIKRMPQRVQAAWDV